MNNNIVDLFYNAAKLHSSRIAVIDKSTSITYSELENNVQQTVFHFKQKGINKEDKVLVFVPMSIRLYEVLLALFHIGAIPVFLDEWSSKKRLNEACEVAQCKVIICNWKIRLLSFFSRGLRSIPVFINSNNSKHAGVMTTVTEVSNNSTALITFSTGSTGLPKAAIRTHGQLTAQFDALKEYLIPDVTKYDMTSLPIVLLINLGLGKTSVIPDTNLRKLNKMNVPNIFKHIKDHQIKSISASPYFIEKLAEYNIKNDVQKVKVERLISGGAPVYPKLAKLISKAFPDAEMKIVYGSTEAEPISSVTAEELIDSNFGNNGLLVGRPHNQTAVKIIEIGSKINELKDEKDLEIITLPNNKIGEIIVSGKHVQKHYLNNVKAEAENKIYLENSFWHKTGDSGFMDDAGNLFLTGRCKDLILYNEAYISPFVYEEQFQNIPNVIVGTIMKMDNSIYAIVELENVNSKDRIKNEILNQFVFISKVIFIDNIPRDPRHYSKIDYIGLRVMVERKINKGE